jgi:hypothetical protein
MRDVFYYGEKPNAHPREKHVISFEDALSKATTEHFWIINERCDYRGFDWDFDFELLPDEDVWAQDHINVWPSQYQKDSGTWLCPNRSDYVMIYRADVDPIKFKELEISKNWKIIENIDKEKFDFKWHPDPSDPPYIYVFGNQWHSGAIMPTVEYHVPGAVNRKYIIDKIAILAQSPRLFKILHEVVKFDFSWRPDPTSPPYIYVFGNNQYPGTVMPTIEFHVEGATERKYINDFTPALSRKPENFEILEDIDRDSFDFSWVPDPSSPPYIYVWGNQWNKPQDKASVRYVVKGATEIKYMEERATRLPCIDNWRVPVHVAEGSFDYSWEPNPNDPPYVYQFGTQWQKTDGPQYYIEGATELKYVDNPVSRVVCYQFLNWQIPMNIDRTTFDFSWHPDLTEDPYIYQFPSQWQRSGGPRFVVEGATDVKYVDAQTAMAKIDMTHWTIPEGCATENFDFSWHPDIEDEPMIYQFGTQHQKTGGPIFTAVGCTENSPIKYIDTVKAKALPTTENWVTHEDVVDFDYSWHPDATEEPYIYQWGNKHYGSELKPTVEYIVPGATQIKHMSQDVKLTVSKKWKLHPHEVDKNKFDFTWRPDPTEPPYIYVWGNRHIPGHLVPTLEYIVEGATEFKYMEQELEVLPQFMRWIEVQPIDMKKFDLSWRPDPREPPFIYVWGNKWVPGEVGSTLEYHCPGATEKKFMDELVEVLPEHDRWEVLEIIDNEKFDFTWRPDPTSPPYIYVFGNQHYSGVIMPTVLYKVLGATEKKYVTDIIAHLSPVPWLFKTHYPVENFDYTWRPDPNDPPYTYIFGNNKYPGTIMPTVEFNVKGATEIKYVDIIATLAQQPHKFDLFEPVKSFDYSWVPDPTEPPYIYVWGNKWVSGKVKSTIEYKVAGATEKKFMDDTVEVLPDMDNWKMILPVDMQSFDFSWRPDPTSPPYIYVWGNKYNRAEIEPTLEYHVPNASERKYMSDAVVSTLPDMDKWNILAPVEDFDYSWRPDPTSPPYIYVFGNQWNDATIEPTVEYHVPNAVSRKFITDIIAKVSATTENWNTLIPVESFDYSWRPNPTSPPYIYVWGNKFNGAELEPTVEYIVPGATERKYMHDRIAITLPDMTKWKTHIPVESFDYSWRPDPTDPPYIYVFGNKWNDATTEPTLEYVIEGATEYKYINDIVATPRPNLRFWQISNSDDLETFDFSWRPNPHSPEQIYQWEDNGPRYASPNVTEYTEVVFMKRTQDTVRSIVKRYKIKTTVEDLINEHQDEVFWATNPDLNYDKFDFSWRPNEENFLHINVFGNEYSMNTQTYYINGPMYMLGHREYNYVEGQTVEIDSNLSMFFVDRGNVDNINRYNELKERYPQIQKTRYLNSWVDTINRCLNKSTTKLCWILNSELDYTDFDFNFYPSPWQMKMVHVFGTQWSHWGTTFMVNTETFAEDTKYVKVIEHLTMLNFVKRKVAVATDCLYDIIFVDHGNLSNLVYDMIVAKTYKTPIVVKFNKSYLQTIKNYLENVETRKEHYIWVCSSVCDYTDFDFSYICDPYAKDQLHVFPSNKQKFGDTFLIDVNKFRSLLDDMLRLEDYEKVNYNQHQRVKRLSAPLITVTEDTHVELAKYNFDFPYAEFVTTDNIHTPNGWQITDDEPMSLWAPDHRNIIIKTTGGSRISLPKDAIDYVERELYDYPYITRASKLIPSNPLDIIFISNGEACADENYEHLLNVTKKLDNKVIRIDGINGRVLSQHTAAYRANTPWYFLVNAKLKVNKTFDFSWQPDRLQISKHYIFNATNPVNGLEYGHQAIVANNKILTLNTKVKGLDFTLDSEHEVVPLNCGIAMYNSSAWDTWRTAFRETIKLRYSGTDENKERLNAWLNIGNGNFGEESKKGASDAMHYYDMVGGDLQKLMLSYDWAWLRSIYEKSVDL